MDIVETVRAFLADNRHLAPPIEALKLCADRLRIRTWRGDRFFWVLLPGDAFLLGVNRLGLYDETLASLDQVRDDAVIFDLMIEDYRGRKQDPLGKVEQIERSEALARLSKCVTVFACPTGYTVVHQGQARFLRFVAGDFVSANPPVRATWSGVAGVPLASSAVPEEVKALYKKLLREEIAPAQSMALAS